LRGEHADSGATLWWDSVVDMTELREIPSHHDASLHVQRLVEVWKRTPANMDRLLADERLPYAGRAAANQTADSSEAIDLLSRAERVALSLLEREDS
jgi:hypothetical protein